MGTAAGSKAIAEDKAKAGDDPLPFVEVEQEDIAENALVCRIAFDLLPPSTVDAQEVGLDKLHTQRMASFRPPLCDNFFTDKFTTFPRPQLH